MQRRARDVQSPLPLLLAVAAEGALLVLDLATDFTFTAVYLLPVLALALAATPAAVTATAVLAVGLAVVSGLWNDDLFSLGHAVRVTIVVAGGALAVRSSRAQRAAHAARREAGATARRLDAMLGTLVEAVTVNDAAGRTVYANETAARLLGAESVDEVLSSAPGELAGRFTITREDGGPVRVEDFPGQRLVRGLEPTPVLTRSVHKATGRAHWLLTKATALRDEDGTPLAVNVIEDVTAAKDAERRQRFLAEAGRLLGSSLDYEHTLESVARLSVPTLADWCAVDVRGDHGESARVAIAHSDPAKVRLGQELHDRYPEDPQANSGVPAVLRTGEPELYSEIPDALLVQGARDEEHLRVIREVGMRSVMLVPIRTRRETIGVLSFVSAESGRSFSADDLAFAQEVADRAAVAVENARLYAQQARTAETLQASLLPLRLPQIEGFSIAASYRPGERDSEVGGDFYDVFPVAGGQMLVLGDVTGKGVRAAALTSMVRHTAKTAARFDPTPSAVLRVVDEVLGEQPALSLVTMVCALVAEEAAGEGGVPVIVALGGHPPPLHVDGRGGAVSVGRVGTLLGAVEDASWSDVEVALAIGETLLLYTDGVTDVPGRDGRFGEVRLLELAARADPEPGRLLERLRRELDAFQAETIRDDQAMLAAQYVGSREALAGGPAGHGGPGVAGRG